MNSLEELQARQLDRYLTDIQAGRRVERPSAVPEQEVQFSESLVALAKASAPDQNFTRQLEHSLNLAVRQQTFRQVQEKGTDFSRLFGRILLAFAGAAAVLAVSFVLLPLLQGPGAQQIAVQPSATATPLPIITETPGIPTATQPALTRQPVATATPFIPSEPVAFLPLSELIRLGIGGGCCGSVTPGELTFILAGELPTSPAQAMAYFLDNLPQLTPELARELAARFGMDALIYMPLGMKQAPEQYLRPNYWAIEGVKEINFDGAELWNYSAGDPCLEGFCNYYADYPEFPLAELQAVDLLKQVGILQTPYVVKGNTNFLLFYTVLDERPVSEPFAVIGFRPDGSISSLTYRQMPFNAWGEVPILSAEEAWQLLQTDPTGARVWINAHPFMQMWGESNSQNMNCWVRTYQAGQQVHLFAAPRILYPTAEGQQIGALVGKLPLSGDLAGLAAVREQVMQHTVDIEAPMHIWGQIYDAGGYLALQVEGYEDASASQMYYFGIIEQGMLISDDGNAYPMPDLTPNHPQSVRVAVTGVLWDGKLEWTRIQLMGEENPPMPQPETSAQVVISAVDLVYLVLPMDTLSGELEKTLDSRAAQPVWRFSGMLGDLSFSAYVQAAREEAIK